MYAPSLNLFKNLDFCSRLAVGAVVLAGLGHQSLSAVSVLSSPADEVAVFGILRRSVDVPELRIQQPQLLLLKLWPMLVFPAGTATVGLFAARGS